MKWEIQLERLNERRLSPENTKHQVDKIAHVLERNSTHGFTAKTHKLQEPELISTAGGLKYKQLAKITVEKERIRSPESTARMFNLVVERARLKAEKGKWTMKVEGADADSKNLLNNAPLIFSAKPDDTIPLADYSLSDFKLPELNETSFNEFFSEIYDREAHIRVMHDAVSDFLQDNQSRNHILLYGDPASCKTTLIERFKEFYEDEYDTCPVIVVIDKTTMSKAGLENTIIDMVQTKTLPKILAIEEIEKGDMANLGCLLTIMGSGRMTKNNARINFNEECPVIIMASCNDEELLRSFQRGALWSRFSHRLYNELPNKELMYKILMDKVIKMGGNPKWVDKAIDLAYNVWPAKFNGEIYDNGSPRGIKGILAGRNRLLDGSYQNDLITINKSKIKKS